MKIHVVCEAQHYKGNGVYSAFMSHLDMMSGLKDVELVVNHNGRGDLLHSHTWTPKFWYYGIHYKGKKNSYRACHS